MTDDQIERMTQRAAAAMQAEGLVASHLMTPEEWYERMARAVALTVCEALEEHERGYVHRPVRQPDDIPLSVLGLSVRVHRALENAGLRWVWHVEDLLSEPDCDVTVVRNIGPKHAAEIRAALARWQTTRGGVPPDEDLACGWARERE